MMILYSNIFVLDLNVGHLANSTQPLSSSKTVHLTILSVEISESPKMECFSSNNVISCIASLIERESVMHSYSAVLRYIPV